MTDTQLTNTDIPAGYSRMTFLCLNELMRWLERWGKEKNQTVPELTCDLVSAAVAFKPESDDPAIQPENAIKKNAHPGYTWLTFVCPTPVFQELQRRRQRFERRGESRSEAEILTTLVAGILGVKLETNAPEIVHQNAILEAAGKTPESVLEAYRAKKAEDDNRKDG